MHSAAFDQALAVTLGYEGGFVNDPHDTGGPTNAGVTQRVYDGFRSNNGLEQQAVSSMSRNEMEDIYYQQYWTPIKGDDLPIGLSFAVFDYAVNSGVSKAVKDFQRVLHVAVDGQCGQITIAAAHNAAKNNASATIILLYCEARLDFCKSLSTYARFGKGWKRRIMGNYDGFQTSDNGVVDYATRFSNDAALVYSPALIQRLPLPLPQPVGAIAGEIPGKALQSNVAALKTSRGRGIAIIMAGLVGQIVDEVTTIVPGVADDSNHMLMFGSMFMLILGCSLIMWTHVRTMTELSR